MRYTEGSGRPLRSCPGAAQRGAKRSAVEMLRPPGSGIPCSSCGALTSSPPTTSEADPPPSRLIASAAPRSIIASRELGQVEAGLGLGSPVADRRDQVGRVQAERRPRVAAGRDVRVELARLRPKSPRRRRRDRSGRRRRGRASGPPGAGRRRARPGARAASAARPRRDPLCTQARTRSQGESNGTLASACPSTRSSPSGVPSARM